MDQDPSYGDHQENEDFQQTLLQSFAAVCGITAMHLIMEQMDEETQAEVKERVIKTWRNSWQLSSQMDLERYNEILAYVSNPSELAQPEEIQQALTHALARAEKIARMALNAEEEP